MKRRSTDIGAEYVGTTDEQIEGMRHSPARLGFEAFKLRQATCGVRSVETSGCERGANVISTVPTVVVRERAIVHAEQLGLF